MYTFSRFPFAAGMLLSLLPIDSIAQDFNLSVDREHIAGVVEAHLASLEGWRTGDVLIRYTTSSEGKRIEEGETIKGVIQPKVVVGPDAMTVIVREDLLFRFVFDFDLQRTVVVNRCQREERVFNSLDEEIKQPVLHVDDRMLLFDKTVPHAFHRLEAGKIHQLNKDKLPPMVYLIRITNVPDIRHLGCAEPIRWDFETLSRNVEFNADVRNMRELLNIGKNRYQVIARDDDEGHFKGQFAIDWDLQRNVPLKIVTHHVPPEAAESVYTANVKWKSVDGYYVPEFGRISNRSITHDGDRIFEVRHETTAELHWFSFNKELPTELFDEQLLRDRKKVDELLNVDVFEANREGK